VVINETLIDSHNFGPIDNIVRANLSGHFTPYATGLYTLEISNTLLGLSSANLFSYIDNISLMPEKTNFFVTPMNYNCETGGTAYFKLKAGTLQANRKYWIWISASGTYPGYVVSGITVPLNYDWLLEASLNYPGLPGYASGFLGELNSMGAAEAKLKVPPDSYHMLGIPAHFAYVLLREPSPSSEPDITFASFPVHIKYVP
jgi:hypothetical protein